MLKKKVLIVEDELLIARDLEQILVEEGFEVLSNVTNVDLAIEKILVFKPDLVLIDINLCGSKDGVCLGRYLQANTEIQYLYTSSFTDKVTLERVKDTRPMGFIVKPFRDIDVKTTVNLLFNNIVHRKLEPEKFGMEEEITDVPYRIKKVIAFIDNNIGEKLLISDLASIAQWQNFHFIRMFTKVMGLTPYRYIIKRRIERSMALLTETNYSIASITYDLGFQNQSSFATTFKKWVGKSPEVFRKEKQYYKRKDLLNNTSTR